MVMRCSFMKPDTLLMRDSFWDRFAQSFERPPRSTLETLHLLSSARSLLANAVSYLVRLRRSDEDNRSTDVRMDRFEQIVGSHTQTIDALDFALGQLINGKRMQSTDLWQAFCDEFKDAGVRATAELASLFRSNTSDGRCLELSRETQTSLLMKLTGYTPLGAALARNMHFQKHVAALLTHPKVVEAVIQCKPTTAANTFLGLYTGASPRTVQRRRQRHRDLRHYAMSIPPPVSGMRSTKKRKR